MNKILLLGMFFLGSCTPRKNKDVDAEKNKDVDVEKNKDVDAKADPVKNEYAFLDDDIKKIVDLNNKYFAEKNFFDRIEKLIDSAGLKTDGFKKHFADVEEKIKDKRIKKILYEYSGSYENLHKYQYFVVRIFFKIKNKEEEKIKKIKEEVENIVNDYKSSYIKDNSMLIHSIDDKINNYVGFTQEDLAKIMKGEGDSSIDSKLEKIIDIKKYVDEKVLQKIELPEDFIREKLVFTMQLFKFFQRLVILK